MSPTATNKLSHEGEMSAPLAGLLVADFTQALSGPYCTLLMSDNGARVIKIERPGKGDMLRSMAPFDSNGHSLFFRSANRAKESIALDLRDPDDLELAENIISKADILVENFRPGVMDRFGLGYDRVRNINPRLIYTSISGFGHTGPMKAAPGFDTVIQGASGLMSITGDPDGHPVRVGLPIGDVSAGMWGYMSTLTALIGRERTGSGCHIDCAMLDGLFAMMPAEVSEYTVTGQLPRRSGNIDPAAAPFGANPAKDRDIIVCCGTEKLWRELCCAMGMPELLEDPRFKDNRKRLENRNELRKMLWPKFKKHPAAYWQDLLTKSGIPNGVVNDISEACNMPQIEARNMLIDAGGSRLAGNPMKLSGYPDPGERRSAPSIDADGTDIRKEFT